MHGSQSDKENTDEEFGSDEGEEANDAVNSLEPGAAIKKMQLLAQEIYNSTPGIAKRKC